MQLHAGRNSSLRSVLVSALKCHDVPRLCKNPSTKTPIASGEDVPASLETPRQCPRLELADLGWREAGLRQVRASHCSSLIAAS